MYDFLFIVPEGKFSDEMQDILMRNSVPKSQILPLPNFFLLQNELDETFQISNIFDKKNIIFLYGDSWGLFLFKKTLDRFGVNTCSLIDYQKHPLYFNRGINDNLKFINSCQNCYIAVINGIDKSLLIKQGIDKNKIIHIVNLDELQYFDSSVVPEHCKNNQEIFIDGGCLNMETSINFIRYCNNELDKIYAFEPNSECANMCKNIKESNEKLKNKAQVIEKGLWSKESNLSFKLGLCGDSRITENGEGTNTSIAVTSIDKILKGERSSFIKMDIEGAELEALRGAKNTIQKYHPKLAISVYHKPEDIITIPSFIKSISPSYHLYLRNYHMLDMTETVLYAFYDE